MAGSEPGVTVVITQRDRGGICYSTGKVIVVQRLGGVAGVAALLGVHELAALCAHGLAALVVGEARVNELWALVDSIHVGISAARARGKATAGAGRGC